MMDYADKKVGDKELVVSVNPLAFPPYWSKKFEKEQQITEKDILEYVTGKTSVPQIKDYVIRYEMLEKSINRLIAVPAEAQIDTKLIQPLRHAAASFMLGNFLDTIAMCGFVSEMLTIFLYETSNIQIEKQKISDVDNDLFGRDFEKLGQDRRIRILKGFSIIDDEISIKFDKIRLMRARYLHRFNEEHNQIAPDSEEIFSLTLDLLIAVLGQKVGNGNINYHPNVLKYLEEKGLLK
jgi:hypothetical protein